MWGSDCTCQEDIECEAPGLCPLANCASTWTPVALLVVWVSQVVCDRLVQFSRM
jgi:hypothetical protein